MLRLQFVCKIFSVVAVNAENLLRILLLQEVKQTSATDMSAEIQPLDKHLQVERKILRDVATSLEKRINTLIFLSVHRQFLNKLVKI